MDDRASAKKAILTASQGGFVSKAFLWDFKVTNAMQYGPSDSGEAGCLLQGVRPFRHVCSRTHHLIIHPGWSGHVILLNKRIQENFYVNNLLVITSRNYSMGTESNNW